MKRYNVTRAANPFAMVVVSALMFLLLQRKLKSFEASWIPTRNLVTNWATSTQTSLNSLGESQIKKKKPRRGKNNVSQEPVLLEEDYSDMMAPKPMR